MFYKYRKTDVQYVMVSLCSMYTVLDQAQLSLAQLHWVELEMVCHSIKESGQWSAPELDQTI